MQRNKIYPGDALPVLKTFPDECVHCCITSPPYWGLRDYGVAGQLGLESTPEEYVAKLVEIFREVRRVLRADGTVWLNLGDSYAATTKGTGGTEASGLNAKRDELGNLHPDRKSQPTNKGYRFDVKHSNLKPKDLVGIPWRVAFALQADGWYLRSDIIWSKPNPMPESVTDRCTKAHEYVFLLTKSARYYYDAEAIKESASTGCDIRPTKTFGKSGNGDRNDGGRAQLNCDGTRNRRSVWTIATTPYPEAHFATFPEKLVEPCIMAGTSEHGCCSECGAPWERVVKRIPGTSKDCPKTQAAHLARGGKGILTGTVGKSGGGRTDHTTQTTGWRPTCDCNAEIVPCVVLDPFAGSGTVPKVALRARRDFVAIELNPEYIPMIERRIEPLMRQEEMMI